MTHEVRLVRLSDAQIADIVSNLYQLFPSGEISYLIADQSVQSRAILKDYDLSSSSHAISRAQLTDRKAGIQVIIARGIQRGDNWNKREPSAYYDEAQINSVVGGQTAETKDVVAALKALDKFLPGKLARRGSNLPKETQDFVNQQYGQLTAAVAELTTAAAKRQITLDEYKEHLETQHQSKLDELDASYLEQSASLQRQRDELEKLKKEIDDREHMHVRRELREQITTDLQDRLDKPLINKTSANQRIAVVLICIVSAGLLFWFALSTQRLFGTTSDTVEKWFIVLKTLLAGAAASGFLVYAISWLRRTYLDDVGLERALERYALDVNRASWSIETLMEMSKQEGAEVPSIWVQGVCNELFVSSTAKEDPTALQALGAILDVAGGAEIGPDGAKITLNRRGTSAVAKSVNT